MIREVLTSSKTPQVQRLLKRFVQSVKNRTLRTEQLKLVFLHFRETGATGEFWEWGSSVAHCGRDQGLLWEASVAFWATDRFYKNLDPRDAKIGPLPQDIIYEVQSYIERTPEWELSDLLDDIFPVGISKAEILAIIEHYYTRGKYSRRNRVNSIFFHLYGSGSDGKAGIDPVDVAMIKRLVIRVRDNSLGDLSIPLRRYTEALSYELMESGISKLAFSGADELFLQLHFLAALHNIIIDVDRDHFRKVSGFPFGDVQPMAFVSAFEKNLTISVGYFEIEDGFVEPAEIESQFSIFKNCRYFYPILVSDLPSDEFIIESDQNIRYSLHNYPIEVRKRGERSAIVALERNRCRYAPSRSRLGEK